MTEKYSLSIVFAWIADLALYSVCGTASASHHREIYQMFGLGLFACLILPIPLPHARRRRGAGIEPSERSLETTSREVRCAQAHPLIAGSASGKLRDVRKSRST
jgi:hypothetical protein